VGISNIVGLRIVENRMENIRIDQCWLRQSTEGRIQTLGTWERGLRTTEVIVNRELIDKSFL